MKRFSFAGAFAAASLMVLAACDKTPEDSTIVRACLQVADELAKNGLRDIADDRSRRFLGKVEEYRARCRGGEAAVAQMDTPWVDWANYWATGGASSKATRRNTGGRITDRNQRGIDGALIDLEYQRMELIKFNLFDNNGTYKTYVTGEQTADGFRAGPVVREWPEMRLPPGTWKLAQFWTCTPCLSIFYPMATWTKQKWTSEVSSVHPGQSLLTMLRMSKTI